MEAKTVWLGYPPPLFAPDPKASSLLVLIFPSTDRHPIFSSDPVLLEDIIFPFYSLAASAAFGLGFDQFDIPLSCSMKLWAVLFIKHIRNCLFIYFTFCNHPVLLISMILILSTLSPLTVKLFRRLYLMYSDCNNNGQLYIQMTKCSKMRQITTTLSRPRVKQRWKMFQKYYYCSVVVQWLLHGCIGGILNWFILKTQSPDCLYRTYVSRLLNLWKKFCSV